MLFDVYVVHLLTQEFNLVLASCELAEAEGFQSDWDKPDSRVVILPRFLTVAHVDSEFVSQGIDTLFDVWVVDADTKEVFRSCAGVTREAYQDALKLLDDSGVSIISLPLGTMVVASTSSIDRLFDEGAMPHE